MSGGRRAEVLFEYVPENEDELSLEVGTIIQNVTVAEEGWMEGTLNGARGVFPDNFVKLLPEEPEAPSSKSFLAKVTFTYEAANEDELSLDVGKVVEVVGEVEEGWWRGRLNGKEGVFPENFVEKMSDQEAEARKKPADQNRTDGPSGANDKVVPKPGFAGGIKLPFMVPPGGGPGPKAAPPAAAPAAAPVPAPAEPETTTDSAKSAGPKAAMAICTFDYVAEAEDELSLVKGDKIEVLDQDVSEGWWEGRCHGKTGVFPSNFVDLLPEEAPAPAPAAAPKKVLPKSMVAMGPLVTPGDLKKASEDRKELKKVPPPEVKKPQVEDPPSRPAKPGPPTAGSKGAAPAPKVFNKPAAAAPPATARRGQPSVPTKKPGDKPDADAEPKKAVLRPVAGSRRSNDLPSTKDTEGDADTTVKPSQPLKRHIPDPVKPAASAEDSQPDWIKGLKKRKNTGESGPPPPTTTARGGPSHESKETPAPSSTSNATSTPAPAASKPPPAKIPSAKQPPPTTTESKPEENKKDTASSTSSSQANTGANMASPAELTALKDDLAKVQKKLAEMETNFVSEIERLEQEIDEEKKARMTMQVEIERLKRRKD